MTSHSKQEEIQSCLSCLAFNPTIHSKVDGSVKLGSCRRECPRGGVGVWATLFSRASWPKVRPTDLCGDYYSKDGVEEEEEKSIRQIGFHGDEILYLDSQPEEEDDDIPSSTGER